MQCPKCELPMDRTQHFDLELDRCAECGSTWFDAGEMTAYLETTMSKGLLRQPVRPGAWKHDPEGPACPGCGKVRLSRGNWKNVEFRACRLCRGVWLDGKALHILSTMGRSSPNLRLRDAPKSADDYAAGILEFMLYAAIGAIDPH